MKPYRRQQAGGHVEKDISPKFHFLQEALPNHPAHRDLALCVPHSKSCQNSGGREAGRAGRVRPRTLFVQAPGALATERACPCTSLSLPGYTRERIPNLAGLGFRRHRS